MARTKLEVNRELMVSCIKEAEKNGPLTNQNALWNEVAGLYNVKAAHSITFSVVALRVKEWGLSVQTQPGVRGRAPGGTLSDAQKAAMQAGRLARKDRLLTGDDAEVYAQIRSDAPERFQGLVDRAERGSKSALLKLVCLDCTCYQPCEISACSAICPLKPFRPYQKGEDEGENLEEPVGLEEDEEVLAA